jgi:hypothetical protein
MPMGSEQQHKESFWENGRLGGCPVREYNNLHSSRAQCKAVLDGGGDAPHVALEQMARLDWVRRLLGHFVHTVSQVTEGEIMQRKVFSEASI